MWKLLQRALTNTQGVFCIFQVKQTQFREMFRAMAPFSYNAMNPYISLEKVGV